MKYLVNCNEKSKFKYFKTYSLILVIILKYFQQFKKNSNIIKIFQNFFLGNNAVTFEL